ncbi:MAG: hypothetical protein KDK53_24115 [Maritimibacter sp.]|nr:hypothetical protein [Maritimibacter sp.]
MTDLSLAPQISLLDRMAGLFHRRAAPKTEEEAEDARARRAFVMDKLNDHPDAFASAHDVHAMMSLYPRQF